MSLTFTTMPDDAFNYIQENAGILVGSFDPSTREYNDILGSTTAGIQVSDVPSYVDWGDDIDNCPKNALELKKIESREVKCSGTFVSLDKDGIQRNIGASDVDSNNSIRIIPCNELKTTDFKTIWFVCDYGVGGFIAVKLMNTLNTSGFQIQTGDKAKGQFAFEFTCHTSIEEPDVVPYEVYVNSAASTSPMIELNKHSVTVTNGDTYTLTAKVVPSNATITWSSGSSSVATVAAGVITTEGAGNTIITASITADGVTYTDTCTVIVEAAA